MGHGSILTQHVLDHFVQHFGLHRLLHEVACAALQCGDNVFLVTDRGHHHDARLGMSKHNLFGGLNPFHLRHGDVHEHDVGIGAVVFGDGSHSVPGLARHLPAKGLHHAGQVLARENGVIHNQVADWLPVLAASYWRKLLHIATSS